MTDLTHGRHCSCSACAREDWTQPHLAPCGMHGKDCPAEYDPYTPQDVFEVARLIVGNGSFTDADAIRVARALLDERETA